MNMRMKPDTTTWETIARKHYRHVTGIEVRYNCNLWQWEIIGGAEDGLFYSRLWVAQSSALRHYRS